MEKKIICSFTRQYAMLQRSLKKLQILKKKNQSAILGPVPLWKHIYKYKVYF